MKRRSFFKSIAAVFGAVAAAPAVALSKSPVPVGPLPVPPSVPKDFSGNYILNGEVVYIEPNGLVIAWDKEEKNFVGGRRVSPIPIYQYTAVTGCTVRATAS